MKNNLKHFNYYYPNIIQITNYVITFNGANCKTYNKSEKTKYKQSEVNFTIKYYQDYAYLSKLCH